VTIYHHNDGQSVSAGFPYYGRIAALRGKFVFGDIVRGRLFVADIAAMAGVRTQQLLPTASFEWLELGVLGSRGRREKREEQHCGKQLAFHGSSSIG
jgi:hypothetical protein